MRAVWPRIGIVALAVLAFAGPASAHTGELPDLIADQAARPMFQIEAGEGGVERLLLRFDSWVHNQGAGPLEIRRAPGGLSLQVYRDADAGLAEVATRGLGADDLKYENTDGHNHWHVQRIARYSLVSGDGGFGVAPAMKVGFCLIDSEAVDPGYAQQRYLSFCGAGQPNPTTNVRMGVSKGWRDLYDRTLPFQWVDASEVLPGTYRLRSEIDPLNIIEESDEVNVPQDLMNQVVPGFNARALDSADDDVSLAADAVGGVTGPQFKVVDGPDHGTLDVAVGDWLTSPDVSYTPDSGGDDRFVYLAADATSAFPRYPGRATVLLGTSGVALSGVPEQLAAGVSVDLDARVVGAPGSVTWSVSRGAIDADGRLTAPSTGGTITVTASAPGGRSDTMAIRVVEPPAEPEPAPSVPVDPPAGAVVPTTSSPAQPLPAPAPTPRSGPVAQPKRVPIGSVRVRRIGRQYVVSLVPRSSGRVRTTLLAGKRKLGTCTVRVAARKSALCRLKVRSGATAIAVTLVKPSGATEQRRVSAPR